MRIAETVELLEIKNDRGVLNLVLTWDKNELILIDTGLPRTLDLIRDAIGQAGFSLEQITKVIITHQDMDHIGCARQLQELGAEILAHTDEAPYLCGDKTSIRIADMEARLNELSDGERTYYEQVKQAAPNFHVTVDRLLQDGEILEVCGGIRVIHTPGHMPGHIALFLESSRILVTGDAANLVDGKLTGANPHFTKDMEQAAVSFNKMMAYQPAMIVCYHGGLYENVSECMRI